jgi:hypothetical protein
LAAGVVEANYDVYSYFADSFGAVGLPEKSGDLDNRLRSLILLGGGNGDGTINAKIQERFQISPTGLTDHKSGHGTGRRSCQR